MNLRKVYGYVPARLNAVLLRFSAAGGRGPRDETAHQVVDDLRECEADLPAAAAASPPAAPAAANGPVVREA